MIFSNIFVSKSERHGIREIGKFEASSDNIGDMLIGMMQTMGMSNPPVATSSNSAKVVSFSKRGKIYTVTLSMYNPPIKVSWTGLIRMEDLVKVIDDVAEARRKIGYTNILSLKNKQKVFQLALAS